MTNSKIKIILVDDHALFRSGLKFLLEQQANFMVVGEAANAVDSIDLVAQTNPDVALIDINMPIMRGDDVIAKLLSIKPNLAILMLTVDEDSEVLTKCMHLGARGYLLKNIDTNFLLDCIYKAVDGDNVLSPEMTSKLINKMIKKDKTIDHKNNNLTKREHEILLMLAQGLRNKEIARKLNLTESTIKVHVQNILRKLELHSRVQAAVYAIENFEQQLNLS